LFSEHYDAALKRAEAEFDQAEAAGTWAKWSDYDGIPPWWVVGTAYIFEIQRGRTLDNLEAEYSKDQIRLLWETLTRADAFALAGRRFGPYERNIAKDAKDALRRRHAFAEYADWATREKLAAFLLSPAVAIADNSGPQQTGAMRVFEVQRGITVEHWGEVEITFLSEFRIQMTIGSEIQPPQTFAEMGFASKKSPKTPVAAWNALRLFAEREGVVSSLPNVVDWSAFEKRVQEIRARFKARFGLSDDPITFKRKTHQVSDDHGYRTKFNIGCHSSYGIE